MGCIKGIRQVGIIIICCFGLLLTGCSTYKFKLHANNIINKNINNTASSTAIYLYQLSDISDFEQASYKELINHANNLNHSVLMRTRVIILPGQDKTINLKADPKTKFIGIVAGYRELNQVIWRQTYAINKHFYDRIYHKPFMLHLTNKGISLKE